MKKYPLLLVGLCALNVAAQPFPVWRNLWTTNSGDFIQLKTRRWHVYQTPYAPFFGPALFPTTTADALSGPFDVGADINSSNQFRIWSPANFVTMNFGLAPFKDFSVISSDGTAVLTFFNWANVSAPIVSATTQLNANIMDGADGTIIFRTPALAGATMAFEFRVPFTDDFMAVEPPAYFSNGVTVYGPMSGNGNGLTNLNAAKLVGTGTNNTTGNAQGSTNFWGVLNDTNLPPNSSMTNNYSLTSSNFGWFFGPSATYLVPTNAVTNVFGWSAGLTNQQVLGPIGWVSNRVAGTYMVEFDLSVSNSTATATIFLVSTNGGNTNIRCEQGTPSQREVVTARGILFLGAGMALSVQMSNRLNTSTMDIKHGNLLIKRIP